MAVQAAALYANVEIRGGADDVQYSLTWLSRETKRKESLVVRWSKYTTVSSGIYIYIYT